MKKTILPILLLLFFGVSANAQTVVYKITFADCIGLQLTTGDVCSAPFPPGVYVEEAKQSSIGNQFGCSWISTGSGTVNSINVEFRYTHNDLINVPTILNSTPNNGQTGSAVDCISGNSILMSWSVDPTNYNVGGGNSFLLDYTASSQINQLDHHSSDGIDEWYFIVTVDYTACSNPTASVTSSANATCFGDSDGSIDITATGGTPPYTYDWDTDGTGDFDDAEDLTGLSAGTYNVTVMDDVGCTYPLSHTVTEPAAIDVTTSQTGATITANATGVSYQWIDCEGPTALSGETNQNFTATSNGNYAVVITDGPCSDTSTCTTVTGLGISAITELIQLDVYPNPVADHVFVKSGKDIKAGKIQIVDMSGRVVLEVQVTFISGQAFELDLSKLDAGNYQLILITPQGEANKQITVK